MNEIVAKLVDDLSTALGRYRMAETTLAVAKDAVAAGEVAFTETESAVKTARNALLAAIAGLTVPPEQAGADAAKRAQALSTTLGMQ